MVWDLSPDEKKIKAIILQKWREEKRVSKKDVVASEYVLGTNGRRVDLALLGASFVGVEIKSDYDSLNRLSDQIAVYQHCFDRVIVVCGSKHVDQCLTELPKHVEIWQVPRTETPIKRRPAVLDFAANREVMSRLFTVSQLRRLVPSSEKRASRKDLLREVSNLPSEQLRDAMTECFRSKFGASSDNFWRSVGRRKIAVDDIANLSRFLHERLQLQEYRQENEAFWSEWRKIAQHSLSSIGNPDEFEINQPNRSQLDSDCSQVACANGC